MESKAEAITRLVLETNTDNRGDLLDEVAQLLLKHQQGFTSTVFQRAAMHYGFRSGAKGEKLDA